MKPISFLPIIIILATALPTTNPPPTDSVKRTIPSSEVDLPAFITAVFNGIANVIAASGGAAANTIAATGGAVANGLGAVPGDEQNSTLLGRAVGEEVGRKVARELEGMFCRGIVE